MKLSIVRDSYYYNSGKLGDINRQLCFSGIAIIWIIKNNGAEHSNRLDNLLIMPLLLFTISLSIDLIQYLLQSILYSQFARHFEKQNIQDDQEVKIPRWINWPAITMFYAKILFTILSYILICNRMWSFIH